MTPIITTRLDSEDKTRFDAFCNSVGITASAAINMFIKATLREGAIPFIVKADPFYSEANQKRLKESIKELDETGGTVHDIDLDV